MRVQMLLEDILDIAQGMAQDVDLDINLGSGLDSIDDILGTGFFLP